MPFVFDPFTATLQMQAISRSMLGSIPSYLMETQSYINACEISDPTTKGQIFDFSNGIYDLGIWNNIVFWMMRLGQNIGTGSTVYSLGGLGKFHGSKADNPTQETDGLRKEASAQGRVELPAMDIASYGQFSIFSVAKINAEGISGLSFLTQRPQNNARDTGTAILRAVPSSQFDFGSTNLSGGDGFLINRTSNSTQTSFNFYGGAFSAPPSCFAQRNSTVNSATIGSGTSLVNGSGGGDATAGGYILGEDNLASAWDATLAISGIANIALSQLQLESIRTLYKNTIGTGLSLP